MTDGDGSGWPTYQGASDRSGYAGGGAPAAEPKKPPWTVDLGFSVGGGMAVANDVCYHPGDYNTLVARELSTGEARWTFEAERDGKIKGGATVGDDTVYVGSTDGHLYAVSEETGELLWEYELEGTYAELTAAPAVGDGTVYFGGENETLHAVDAHTGEEEWTMELEDDAVAAPLVHEGRVYVGSGGTYGTTFYAVDPEFGIADWTLDGGMTGFQAAAAADGDTVYVPGETGPLYALDAETGDVQWEADYRGGGESAPVVADGSVYFVYDNGVRSVDADTGDPEWTFETSVDWALEAPPAVAEGVVYVPGYDEILYAVDAESGEELWSYDTGEVTAPPVVADGAVIYGTHETSSSELVALTEGADPVGAGGSDASATEDGATGGSDRPSISTVTGHAATDGDWPTRQGTAARTGYVGGGAPEGAPKKPAWNIDGPDLPTEPLAIAGGAVVLPGEHDSVVAYDVETGAELWEFEDEAHGGRFGAGVAVAGDTVYAGTDAGYLFAIDAHSGQKRWEYELEGTYADVESTPAVRDGVVYVGAENQRFHAVDAETGAERWTMDLDDDVVASPVVHRGRVYVGTEGYGDSFHAVDPEYGVADWTADVDARWVAAPAASEGRIYAPAEGGPLYALDAETGDVCWEGDITDGETAPAVGEGIVVQPDSERVRAFDAETGDHLWDYDVGQYVLASPAVAEGTVYVGSDDECVAALDAETGEERWRFDTPGSVESGPAVADGALFVAARDYEANLFALTEGADPVEAEASVAGGDVRDAVADTRDVEHPQGSDEEDEKEVDTPDITTETGRAQTDGDWPTRQGTAARTGYAGGGTPDGPPKKPPWNVDGDAKAKTPLTVAHGALLLPGEQNSLVAYDVESGSELWTFEDTENDGRIRGGATVADDTVYVGSEGGYVYALDVRNGEKQWEYELDGTFAEVNFAPAVRDSVVFFGGNNERFHAVDAETGEEHWTMDLADDSVATPVVHRGRVYFGTGGYGTTLHAVDPEFGVDDWTFDDRREFDAAPAAADGVIFAPGDTGPLYALDAETGDVCWEGEIRDGDSSPAVADGRVFHADSERVRAFDAETGDHLWDYEVGMYVQSSPAVAEGTVYVGTDDERVLALDAETGEEEWAFDRIGEVRTGPAVADGAVFVASREYEENVYALTEGADPVAAEASVAGGDIRDAVPDANDGEDSQSADDGDGAGDGDEVDDEDGEESLQEALDRDDEYLSVALDRIDDPQNPTDDEIQAAILGVVNDEWVTGTHQAVLRSDVIGQQIAERVPGATEGLVRQNVESLAEEAVVGGQYQNRYILVRSRPASVDTFQDLTGERIVAEHELLDVLEPLYERTREQPRDAGLAREALLEASFLDEDDLDRIVWYLDNAGKWVEDIVLVTGTVGYVDTIQTNTPEPYVEVELNAAGKELYDDLS